MKILYKQTPEKTDNNIINKTQISNCYLKELTSNNDYKKTTLKCHFHTEYELHMVMRGRQDYNVSDKTYVVNEGAFILIPPMINHNITFTSENLVKYSISFDIKKELCNSVYYSNITQEIKDSIGFISKEFNSNFVSSSEIIENRVFEIIILLLRIIGYEKSAKNICKNVSDDSCLNIAKKFISDNIELNPSPADVADNCHLSTRQLARKFYATEGISPFKYIKNIKMHKIAELLKNSDLSLAQISERFSYSNVYYFNSAFKKHFGMPPNSYRRMFR